MSLKRITVGNMYANAYVYANEETHNAVLFDAADQPEKILKYLSDNKLKLKFIFQTHAHYDHIGALDVIKEATGARLVIHGDEIKYLYDNSINLGLDLAVKSQPDIIVKDNDIIDFDDEEIKVIHTPGHTTGSCCFLIGDKMLISGDTLFHRSIGRADFPLGNLDDELNSIRNKLMLLDDSVTVHPGHGFGSDIGSERRENPYLI